MSISNKYGLKTRDIVLVEIDERVLQRTILNISPKGNAVCFNNYYGDSRWYNETQFKLVDIMGNAGDVSWFEQHEIGVWIISIACFFILGIMLGIKI